MKARKNPNYKTPLPNKKREEFFQYKYNTN